MFITEKLKDKRILVWGYGREGKSTENFIKKFCEVKDLVIFEGKQDEIDESRYDYIIKSPGIVAQHYNEKYTSQTELFLEEFGSQTIGVTGTKGKSTTASLLYSVLSDCLEERVLLVGNIGYPCLDYYEEIDRNSVVVFEMSCHQLSNLRVSPHIAVFLNLYEEHLDYYGTFEKYFAAKKNITLNQGQGDFFFCGDEVPEFETRARKKIIFFDKSKNPEAPADFDMQLKGTHNQYNARFVYEICRDIFAFDDEKIRKSIKEFQGLKHRLEFVGNIGGIDFYDDSISTIPEASIQALSSIKNAATLLIGGMDRHIHYELLVDFIKKHSGYNYIMAYESGKRIFDEVKNLPYCHYVEDLKGQVELAKKITPEGGACILSPAAPSYGYFKNFEERGDCFAELARLS